MGVWLVVGGKRKVDRRWLGLRVRWYSWLGIGVLVVRRGALGWCLFLLGEIVMRRSYS